MHTGSSFFGQRREREIMGKRKDLITSHPAPVHLDEMCRGSKAILTLDRCRQTELRSETEQVMSTTGGTMITLVHQLERENWSTRAML